MDVTLTSFGGPGAPCTLLHSDALDLRVVLDCGATPVPPLLLRAPDVRALVAAAAAAAAAAPERRLDPCPFADAVLLTSPAAVLGLPLLYRAAVDAAAEAAAAAAASRGGGGEEGGGAVRGANAAGPSYLPPLPLHTYATEACLEIAEHWIAELLDAEDDRTRRAGGGTAEEAAALAAAASRADTPPPPPLQPPTTTTTNPPPPLSPLFSARDARRALACVRPVRFGERLALPGGGRVVAEALPASGARLGVCCWRLRAGATERIVYLGPCASLLKGHAAPLDLRRALAGARAVVLAPGAIAVPGDGGGGEDGDREGEDEGDARRLLLLAEGRPRPPLLEQSLRGGADPADALHAAAVHCAARAALDAVAAAARGVGAKAAPVAAADAVADAPAASAAVVVAVDPTGAAFDFLEALEHEARLEIREQQQGPAAQEEAIGGEDDEEDEDAQGGGEEEEEEGELEEEERQRPPPTATPPTPPVSVSYAGPAAEGSLALAASAAEFLSPGRLSRVVRRAAAPFAHCRMMRVDEEEEDEEEKEGGGARARRPTAKQQQRRRHGPLVRLRVVGLGASAADVALVPAVRFLARAKEGREEQGAKEAADHPPRRLLILLGTAATAASSAPGRVILRVPLPGERGLDPAALLAGCDGVGPVVIAAGSQREADALSLAAAAAAAAGNAADDRQAAPPPSAAAPAVVAYGRAPSALPPLPAPLYEAWLSGPLAARVVLSPLSPPAGQAPPLSAARLPPVRLSAERGGGVAWRFEDDDEGDDEAAAAVAEAAIATALRRAGFEVPERWREEDEYEDEDEDEGGKRRGGGSKGRRVVATTVLALSGGAAAEVRLTAAAGSGIAAPTSSSSRLRSVVVLADDAPLCELLREVCDAALRRV